ncbi:hypothetical protein KKG72_01055 [bacterium]|nr:hypothetical protein [bacterium]MBU1994925.1 hypothetical protein [bacterium]
MNKVIYIILSAFLLGGCGSAVVNKKSYEKKECEVNRGIKEYYDYDVDYILLADNAVDALFKTASVEPKNFIVTDFVDLTSLQNYSKLGYILSNSIKNSLIQKHSSKVVEAEISKYFEISGNGLRVLSRDIKLLRADSFELNRAVVGTYTYTEEEIIVFVKLIDLQTGIIEGSYAKKLPMTCEIMYLLTQQ